MFEVHTLSLAEARGEEGRKAACMGMVESQRRGRNGSRRDRLERSMMSDLDETIQSLFVGLVVLCSSHKSLSDVRAVLVSVDMHSPNIDGHASSAGADCCAPSCCDE